MEAIFKSLVKARGRPRKPLNRYPGTLGVRGGNVYHIGVIEHVISPKGKGVVSSDDTMQAVVKMWDNNLLILLVDKKISRKVKKGDYVLSDYTPMSPESRHRKLYVTKVLPKKEGARIWKEFQGEAERRKKALKQIKPPYSPYIR
jgi:hypothetical protein